MNIRSWFCIHKWVKDENLETFIFFHTNPSKYKDKCIIACKKCGRFETIDINHCTM